MKIPALFGGMVLWLGAAGTALAAGPVASPQGKAVRALVIGIDHYERFNSLKGAVADARDIEAALLRSGVPRANVTTLLDAAANRDAVKRGIEALIAAAAPGETVIITFAGHGAQLKDARRGSDRDGMKEIFVLGGYATSGPGTAQRIEDKELNFWLRQFDRKGVGVIFVADTCHGGGLARTWGTDAGPVSFRAIDDAELSGPDHFRSAYDEPQPNGAPVSMKDLLVTIPDLKGVTFLAAVDKNTRVPEIAIPGQASPRGALSYAFARALERFAASDDAALSRRELFGFSRQLVLQAVDGRQTIQTEPVEAQDLEAPVFSHGTAPADAPVLPDALAPEARVRIAILGGQAGDLAAATTPDGSFLEVASPEEADLVWNKTTGQITSRRTGDVVARDVQPGQIEGIADRTSAVASLNGLSSRNPESLAIEGDPGRVRTPGDKPPPMVAAAGVGGRHLVVFNLAYDGQVQMLFPPQDVPTLSPGPWRRPLAVTPPFGVDHVVVVSSTSDLGPLARWLWQRNGRIAAREAAGEVSRLAAARPDLRIGTAGLHTAPAP